MENLLIYFVKANGLIILFYLMYVLFLRKETFFNSNRWYLITGLLLSLVLPLITFTKTIWIEPTPLPEVYKDAIPLTYNQTEIPKETVSIDWSIILSSAYIVIAILILVKIGIELIAFFGKIQKHNKLKNEAYTLVETNINENPFSFFRYIVINKNMFTDEEIEHILTHESIHVNQKHSFDVLLGKLFCAFFWGNPIIWLYRKSMLQNLEFIADNETFQQIENKYAYQKTLLKVVTHQHSLGITNQFYQSLIKKRIVMLNTNQSNKRNAWKYATILPLLVGFFVMFQIETVAQVKEIKIEESNYTVSSSYSSVLTKNSTDKEIKELEKTFSDEKQKLIISDIKRNKNDEIIEIKLEFSSKKNSKSKNIKIVKGDKPILPIKIFIKEDKNDEKSVGFEEVSNLVTGKYISVDESIEVDSITSGGYTIDNMVKNGKKVKLIINGKLQPENEKIKIPLDQELDVLKELDEKELKSKYNIDKKEGEVYYEFTTKKDINIKSEVEKNNSGWGIGYHVVSSDENNNNNTKEKESFTYDVSYTKTEQGDLINNIKKNKNVDAKKALIIFNDKEITYEELVKVNTKEIASSSVMTATTFALKKYGEKAKNGVIIIETKEFFEKNNPVYKEYLNSKRNSEKPKPRVITIKNGDDVVVFDGDKIKFPGYPTHYLNQLKLELRGKILEDNIDFFKNYEFEKIKDLIIIEDEMSPKEKKRIKKIIIETK
ncbi:M56 family metallopeptidase [Flavobacterium channae]|uniref:M56 family metallopeptidase n=1 Tax=Flavobacterium channae TaxID=2897181 RepID=UPI001E31A299|nr:M56 family metallopeptidase [Flavobacterium channae]UGS24612.1 M56 family metallopeptidase [Flavobacterium channae]